MKLKIKTNFDLFYRKKNFKHNKVIDNFLKNLEKDKNFNRNFYYNFNKNYIRNINFKKLKKFKKFNNIIVIGLGGSSLGTMAIYSLFKEKIKKKVIFLNSLDLNKIKKINSTKGKNSLFLIISKSGETLEVLTNINHLNNINFNESNTIIITEKKNNSLYKFSKRKNIKLVEHNKFIGGRYSVLSEVGIVPCFLMGLNIKGLRNFFSKKISNSFITTLKESVNYNNEIYKSKKIGSLIFLTYSSKLHNLVLWCQQLISESLGKKNLGILPVLSPAPKDHHSLLQLYLDGPRDKIFYILSLKEEDKKSTKNIFTEKYSFLKTKTFNQIKNAQKEALIKTLRLKKIPYKEFFMSDKTEKGVTEFLVFFMLETIITAKLLGINPFNQPAVEQVKILTKNILT